MVSEDINHHEHTEAQHKAPNLKVILAAGLRQTCRFAIAEKRKEKRYSVMKTCKGYHLSQLGNVSYLHSLLHWKENGNSFRSDLEQFVYRHNGVQ